MAEKPTYYDVREDFWREHFSRSLDYDRFLEESDPIYSERWQAMADALPDLNEAQRERLSGHDRRLHVLAYVGAWCGDCVRALPMIKRIVENLGSADLKLIDRDESEALKDELRILGAMRVPMVVFLSEDFHEVMRVGDRTLTPYRRKHRIETGPACDTGLVAPSAEELEAEQDEWVDLFERVLLMLRLAPPLRERYKD
ncbi:MAG: thioredoxin family protein [Planctomycetota bacterium]|jgi:thiol-disulfide isomerase/thioredoxin